MTGPDVTIDPTATGGTLNRLGGSLGAPAAGTAGAGGSGFDALGNRADTGASGLRADGTDLTGKTKDGVNDQISGDRRDGSRFDGLRPGSSGRGPGGGGLGGVNGGGLEAFRSNMPASAGSMLQALPGMAQQVQQIPSALLAPLQGGLSGPQQMLAPLSSMLGGSGGFGSPLSGSASSMSAAVPGGAGRVPADQAARLQQFLDSTTGGQVMYAWGGGHGGAPGPTQGTTDGGGAADAHGDYAKVGVDCSGYTRWGLAAMAGSDVLGSSTSQSQYSGGRAVTAPQPGDLAFPASAGRPPGHVQLYIGNGQVAEAPQSGETVRVRAVTAGTEFRRYLPDAA